MVDSVTICNRLSFYSFVAEIRVWRLSEINELSMVINVSIAVTVMQIENVDILIDSSCLLVVFFSL